MCCGGTSNDCSCGSQFITNVSIAGDTGPAGPAGTTVLTWDTTTYTPATTGADTLFWSYTLAADELPTDGDEIEIIITGAWLNNAVRYLKLDINTSSITTLAQAGGALANGVFVIRATITRVSNSTTEGFSISHWNSGSTTQSLVGFSSYTTDFASNQLVRLYVNQDVASSVRVDSIKIKKSIL